MAQYLAPGVYIEEIAGPRPIESVGTATGAFVGIAERGPIGEPVLVTNWTQYVETFGGFIANGYLPYAVRNFFDEGGGRCYVVRTCHYETVADPTTAQARTARAVLSDRALAPQNTLAVEATSAGSWGDNLAVLIEDGPGEAFHLTVLYQGVAIEPRYSDLTMDDVVARINGTSPNIRVIDLASPTTGADRRPAVSAFALNDLEVTALAPGLAASIAAGTDAGTFKLVVSQAASDVETYDNLSMENVARRINGVSDLILVNDLPSGAAPAVPTGATELPFFRPLGGWDGLRGITLPDRAEPPANTLAVSAWRSGVSIDIGAASTDPDNRFKLTVRQAGAVAETFDNLTMATVEQEVNEGSALIEVNLIPSGTVAPANRPAETTSEAVHFGLDDGDFLGDEAAKNGLHAFDEVDDINIVAIPDRPGDRETIIGALTYCQNRKDCFFVADPLLALSPQQVLSFKQGTGDFAGSAFNSSYGALYYPWILVNDMLTGGTRLVPPSGAAVGTYSATDVTRGVHKAPAGVTDGFLNSAVGIERLVTKGESELLNPNQINAIRSFPTSGVVVWGARTLSNDAQWKYVNVRRLLLFIEESIENGTQWVVFEPNDRALWARLKREVTAFLTVVWQSGALFGATAEEAFFVKVDDENNPPESRDLGRLVVDVGVAPVKPAEFVIFRLTQKVAASAA
jgi:phage tail sheath protein FI